MKKFYTLFIITLLACINIVLVGYSTFYFNTEVSNSPNVGVAVNNIKQNYGRNEDSTDYYDVYVFPQPRYAFPEGDAQRSTINNPSYNPTFVGNDIPRVVDIDELIVNTDDVNEDGSYEQKFVNGTRVLFGKGNDYDGYWEKYHSNTDMAYKPILIQNVYKRLSPEQFDLIGNPIAKMKDARGYELNFAGWTYSKNSAINYGYGGMNDLNLLSPFFPLSEIDKTDIDGSNANDKKIFLYPIFTTGKDYGITSASSQPSNVSITNGIINYFLPYETSFNNLYVARYIPYHGKEDQFKFSLGLTGIEGWIWEYDSTQLANSPVFDVDTGTQISTLGNYLLFDEDAIQGYYNLYVGLNIKASASSWLPPWSRDNNGYIDTKSGLSSGVYDSLKSKINTSVSNISSSSYIKGNLTYKLDSWNTTLNFELWICTERVYEYKVIGGPADSYEYFSINNMNIYRYYPKTTVPSNTEYYHINNVYFNSNDTFKYTHELEDGSHVTNEYRETTFTIAAAQLGVDYSVSPFNSDAEIPQFVRDELDNPLAGFNFNSACIKQAKGIQSTIDDDHQYTYTNNNDLLQKQLLYVENPGFYDLFVQVEYNSEHAISEIKVCGRRVPESKVSINLLHYVSGSLDKFNTVLPINNEKFIDLETSKFTQSVGNYYKGQFKEYYKCVDIDINTKYSELGELIINAYDMNGNIIPNSATKLKDFLSTNNYSLIDHTTGLPVDLNSNQVIRLHHIFYLVKNNP